MKSMLPCLFLIISVSLFAQQSNSVTSANERLDAFEKRESLRKNSLIEHIPFDNIGPTVMSGRITDIDVNPNDPTHFLVAYASGGLWITKNNGTSFEPLFDKEAVMTIGDIAADWNKNTIWVGTGEVNSSRSSYAGTGIYKSTDGGKNWKHMGLSETHHIGRIVLHPNDPEVLWVAALGHLYSENSERGVFKSTDAGESWTKTLFIDNKTGAVDLLIDPANSNILYSATWEKSRSSWNFVESGNGTGIFKSTDGGNRWQKITNKDNGFPTGEGVGRIGLALTKHQNSTRIYALVDNYFRRPDEPKEDESILVKNDFKTMTKEEFIALDKDKLQEFLTSNRFPKKYSAKSVKELIEKDKINPPDLANFLENANSQLFDTPVIGAELYRSDDGGKTWEKTHEEYLDAVYFSYGYYFGVITADIHNPDHLYIAGVPILKSKDGGKTFSSINGDNVHVDHHAIWLNPERPGHIINGNDGGINISYDDGEKWIKCNTPAVGQFYYINVDMAEPYNVYGGLQDNGVWVGPSTYSASTSWHGRGAYPYKSLVGGDGMQVQIDSRDNNTVYTGSQFGNYVRMSKSGGARKRITPIHELGERPFRWNWQAPIIISTHNQDIIYFGAHKLFRSFDKGDHFKPISGDLTQGGKNGDVPYGTLSTIHESTLKFGLIYTGSDDGLVHVTKDGGNNWELISSSLPKDLWVSRVQASSHQEATVYLSLNGYRSDHFDAYVYKSVDYGQTWERIGTGLPKEPVNVIKEDPKDPKILYVGTDHSTYVSIDGGIEFMHIGHELPDVPVHDLVIHPREGDLLVGTHGRSIYKGDIKPIRELNKIKEKEVFVYKIEDISYNSSAGRQFAFYRDPIEPKQKINVYAKNGGKATLEIQTKDGRSLFNNECDLPKGISQLSYDLSVHLESSDVLLDYLKSQAKDEKAKENIKVKEADSGKIYLQPGTYKLLIKKDGFSAEQEFKITPGNGRPGFRG